MRNTFSLIWTCPSSLLLQAFIKLESIESLTQEQKDAYEELALEIFTKYAKQINFD